MSLTRGDLNNGRCAPIGITNFAIFQAPGMHRWLPDNTKEAPLTTGDAPRLAIISDLNFSMSSPWTGQGSR